MLLINGDRIYKVTKDKAIFYSPINKRWLDSIWSVKDIPNHPLVFKRLTLFSLLKFMRDYPVYQHLPPIKEFLEDI